MITRGNRLYDSIDGGGEAKEVVAGGELPIWHPDGSKIDYCFGSSRLAGWKLDVDDAAIKADANLIC